MIKTEKLKRKFGFVKDNIGIMSRYSEEKKNWKEHLNNTERFITEHVTEYKNGLCLILGSGWCLDVPVEELSEKFDKVIFADVIHPRQIKHKVEKIPNIELLTIDISGILEPLYLYKKQKLNENLYEYLKKHVEIKIFDKLNPDFVASVNLLSQLSYFSTEYINMHNLASLNEQVLIKNFIEENHIEILPEGKSVLITDYYAQEYNFKGQLINEQNRLSISLPSDKIKKEWIWDFDLSGNYHTGNPVKFKVAALQV